MQGQEIQRGELGGKCFGRGHTDLRPTVRVEHPVGFTRQGTADDVDDRDDARTFLLRLSRSSQRIGRLTGLRNRNEQVVLPDQRIAIPKLAADIHLNRSTNHLFEQILSDLTRMPGRAAGHDPDALNRCEFLRRQADIRKIRLSSFIGISSTHGIKDGLRLFVNLFQHEVGIAAFLRCRRIPRDRRRLTRDGMTVGVGEVHLVLSDHRHVPLFEIGHFSRVREHRHHIGSDVGRVLRPTDDQRAAGARGNQRSGFALGNHRQRITAPHVFRREPHRIGQLILLLKILIDQMGDNLRIGFRFEFVAVFLQLLLQLLIVFDNSVVHQHAPFRSMRMGILFRGLPMGRPPSMADSDRSLELVGFECHLKISQFAHAPSDSNLFSLHDSYSGGVVSSVLQLRQSPDENRNRILIADVSDDSTHGSTVSVNA